MLARITRHPFISAIAAGLILLGLLIWLIGSADEAPDTTSAPRPTRTPGAGARPTATPRPAAARPTPAGEAGGSAEAEWTVLVYLDGDNDLEQEAIGDFAEMASVGSNDALNIVVQFDRVDSSEDWDDASNGGWAGVKRFLVQRGKKPTKSNQLADLGERNMGDPRTLADFASWGVQAYPARHYALIFWDHGASWPGMASDDSSDGDMLTLPELAEALGDVQRRTGLHKFDLLGFDACLMGQIDVLQAVAPFGEVAIGSADLEPGEGWAWNAWLADVVKNPQQDAAQLAPSIIKSFTAFYKKERDPSVTLAAFDLNQVGTMSDQLDTLASALIDNMPKAYKAIGKARSYAAEYASGDSDISAIDLGYFADSLVDAGANPEIADAARALSQTIKAARISQGFGADHPKSTGISVYFPRKQKHYDTSYLDGSPLTGATRWDEFLQAFYRAGRARSTRAGTSQPTLNRLVAAPDEPVGLQASIAGDDTAYVYYFAGRPLPNDPKTVEVLALDYIYPPGATLGDTAHTWRDGDPVQLSWKSTSWYLSSGSQVVLAPLGPVDYGSNTYSVEGTYTRKSGARIPVSIEFSVAQGRGTLEHIWAFDKGGGDNPRPRELQPKPGDTFTPEIMLYATEGDGGDDRVSAGAPITFGGEPLNAFEGPAPAGAYVIGLMVENIAGEISDQYASVTVANPGGADLPAAPGATPAPEAGAAPDLLTFEDDQLGVRIDYPRAWQVASPGTDKVVFANRDEPGGAELGVDAYALEGTLAAANRAMLEDLLATGAERPGFELRGEIKRARLAGHDGLRAEYVYLRRDGTLMRVVGVAVSDRPAEATYLITYETPEPRFAAERGLLERILASLEIYT